MPFPRPRPAAALGLLAVLSLPACAGAPEYPILATAAPAEVPAGTVLTRTIEVTLSSASDSAVTVTGGAVFSPYFERLDATAIGIVIPPGGDAPVSLPLGVVACPASEGPSSAQLVLEVDGEELLQTVLVSDAALARINEEMCALLGGEDQG